MLTSITEKGTFHLLGEERGEGTEPEVWLGVCHRGTGGGVCMCELTQRCGWLRMNGCTRQLEGSAGHMTVLDRQVHVN